jgi:hypothetical protein
MAQGRHSQLILVLPSLDIVAVMTGFMPDYESFPALRLINYIIDAARSITPLPPDAAGEALLATAIRDAATQQPSSPTGAPPALAQEISGKIYRFEKNELRAETLSLNLVAADPTWETTVASAQPDAPPERFYGPLGLDGRFAISPLASYGIEAVRAHWLNDRVLIVNCRILGHGETQRWELTFEGRKLDVHFTTTDKFTAELHGEQTD